MELAGYELDSSSLMWHLHAFGQVTQLLGALGSLSRTRMTQERHLRKHSRSGSRERRLGTCRILRVNDILNFTSRGFSFLTLVQGLSPYLKWGK